MADVTALESNSAGLLRRQPALYAQLRQTAVLAAAAGVVGRQTDTTVDELLELLCRFHCNNFGVVNQLLVPQGAGCYPWGALLNHGCDGNCVLM
jgi:SET and MYND domain-containing protein